MVAMSVVQETVIRFGDDGHTELGLKIVKCNVLNGVFDGADAVGAGQQDWPVEHPHFVDPETPGHFSIAVENVTASEDGIKRLVQTRHDGGHPRANRSIADTERTISRDDGDLSNSDARHIRDRIEGTRVTAEERHTKITGSWAAVWGWSACGWSGFLGGQWG